MVNILKEKPLISVIVPVYNTEKFLKKCLESIQNQTYGNLEIILVDDASPDKCSEIMDAFVSADSRFKVVTHTENRGLFQARLTGVDSSNGDFIAFVDSDDYISVDWFRLLVKKAVDTGADMVVGQTVCEDENEWKYIFNLPRSFHLTNKEFTNKAVFQTLLEGQGSYFSLHTVWNKLYRKDLWSQCLPHFKEVTGHFIMTEDIAFSFVLYFYAKSIIFTDIDAYFYYQHSESSTKNVNTVEKITKVVKDLGTSFAFVEQFMKVNDVYQSNLELYNQFKNKYFGWWSHHVKSLSNSKEFKEVEQSFFTIFEKSEHKVAAPKDDAFFKFKTTWCGEKEYVKEQMLENNIKIISFDIFDTLVVRPFYEPSDLYIYMQSYFETLIESNYEFRKIRQNAESLARKIQSQQRGMLEDITLDEIYNALQEEYKISEMICTKLKEREVELELKFITRRDVGYELFDFALSTGKQVVLTSDMYLTKNVIEQMLLKTGYDGYFKLYLSSDIGLLKHTGNLFQYVLKDLNIKDKKSFLHLGDNQQVDFETAKRLGLNALMVPKTKDILCNNYFHYTGDVIADTFRNGNSYLNYNKYWEQMPLRTLLSLSVNKLFDNPYIVWNDFSNYNADPYVIGNLALGSHLFGLCKWLIETGIREKRETIHFLARDGYLPKLVYDKLAVCYENAPKSNYIYGSRKSLLPASLKTKADFYLISSRVSVTAQTPRMILKLLAPILNELTEEHTSNYREKGVMLDVNFKAESDFKFFIDCLFDISYNESQLNHQTSLIERYFSSQVTKNDAVFDLGYSGNLHGAIVDILGFSVPAYYLHSNGYETTRVAEKYGFSLQTYYDFSPIMSGIVNELIFSDYRPSCICYQEGIDLENMVVLEENRLHYSEIFLIQQLHLGCLDFIEDFIYYFSEDITMFPTRNSEVGVFYEKFLIAPRDLDKELFSLCTCEDEFYGGIECSSVADIWGWQINHFGLNRSGIPVIGNSQLTGELADMYADGLFVAMYRKLNKLFPKGSSKREFLKKFVRLFLK